MRHRMWHKKLGRNSNHRLQLLRNLACSLILNGKINTTIVKAKSLRRFFEPIVTKSKTKTINNVRRIRKIVFARKAVAKVINVIGPRYSLTAGGYIKITRLKLRHGDGATLSLITFV